MNIVLFFTFLIIPPEYHTFEETKNFLDSIIPLYSEICKMETLNFTQIDSNPILLVKISDNVNLNETEPPVLLIGVHHAEEVLGLEICLELIKNLLTEYGSILEITQFVNENEIYIIPCLNPDGHGVVTSKLCEVWRKNKRDNNGNGIFDYTCGFEGWGDGVDLNRNYDYRWQYAGSPYDTSEYYRGPYAFSEPETRSVRDLCKRENFVMAISYHSARTGMGEVIYYPWRDGALLCPDFPFINEVAESLAWNIMRDDSSGPYIAMITNRWTGGYFRNWIYTDHGTLPFLIEVSDTTIPPGYRIDGIIKENLDGVYYILRRASYNILKVVVSDSITGIPLSAWVRIIEYDTIPEIKHISTPDNGDIFRILHPGNYTLEVTKTGYKQKVIPFTLNEGEKKEIYVNLCSVIYDTFPEIAYILDNIAHNKIIIAFWVRQNSATIKFSMTDIMGRKIKHIEYKNYPPGFYRKEINFEFPAGVYLTTVKVDKYRKKSKVIVVK